MDFDTIETLLEEQLKDLYSAENQLLKALPKMAKKATSAALKDAFTSHLEETRTHVERLQQIGEAMGFKLGGHKCEAMAGLIEEGSEVLEADGDDTVIDAALVASAQRVEHYEIAAYGTTRALAERVGDADAVDLLQQTLDEEGAADKKLTAICEGELLPGMPSSSDESAEGEEGGASTGTAGASSRGRAAKSRAGGSRPAKAKESAGGKSGSRGAASRAGTARAGRAR